MARSASGFTQSTFGPEDHDFEETTFDGQSRMVYEFQVAIQTVQDGTHKLRKLLPEGFQDVTSLDSRTISRIANGVCKGTKLDEMVDELISEVRPHRLLLLKYASPPSSLHEQLRVQVNLLDQWITHVERFSKDFARLHEKKFGSGHITGEDIKKSLKPFDDSVPMTVYAWRRKLEELFRSSVLHLDQRGQFVIDQMLSPSISILVKEKLGTKSPKMETIWEILIGEFGGISRCLDKTFLAHEKLGCIPSLTGASEGILKAIQTKASAHEKLIAGIEDLSMESGDDIYRIINVSYVRLLISLLPSDVIISASDSNPLLLSDRIVNPDVIQWQFQFIKQSLAKLKDNAASILKWVSTKKTTA